MLPFIIWKDAYSVGVEELDNQHKKIISIINELYAHLQKGTTNPQILDKIVTELKEYTQTHFQYEEHLMEISEYPELTKHKAFHKKMIKKTFDMFNKPSQQDWDDLSHELLNFLKEWWVKHILHIDQKYIPCLTNNKE